MVRESACVYLNSLLRIIHSMRWPRTPFEWRIGLGGCMKSDMLLSKVHTYHTSQTVISCGSVQCSGQGTFQSVCPSRR